MDKSRDAFRTISEVAEWLSTPAHVLRFWETKFAQLRPLKRAGGRRYYRPSDMLLLGGIKRLLHEDGMTIKGVQKILREKGIRHVAELSKLTLEVDPAFDEDDSPSPAPVPNDDVTAQPVTPGLLSTLEGIDRLTMAQAKAIAAQMPRLRALHSRLSTPV